MSLVLAFPLLACAQPAAGVASPASASAPMPASPAVAPGLRDVLAQVHAGRDKQRSVSAVPTQGRLRIGQDALDLAITSSHAGHMYIVMAASDQQSLYLLFPNGLDRDNTIAAGQTVILPRPAWRFKADGPAGDNTLLVVVTESPRDLRPLADGGAGPIAKLLTDADARVRLQRLLLSRGNAPCAGAACSDVFGSALLTVSEY